MTRRGFFRLLGLAAVTAPATATLVPEKLSGIRAWWVPVEQWVKEFDWGMKLGVARAYRNVLTGERVRNAVRMRLTPHMCADGSCYACAVTEGARHLDRWAADLPAWRPPARPGHGHFDDVLEGHERVLDSLGLLGERVA